MLTNNQKQRYTSYRIYFNATYSTYRIEFFDAFYISGPAVYGQGNNTATSGEYYDKEHRRPMQKTTTNGVECYTITTDFTQGSKFAFFVNDVTTVNNYCEDGNALTGKFDDVWKAQAPTGDANKDYAYYNHVRFVTNGDNEENSLGASNDGILWTLPTGRYTLRFYGHDENTSNPHFYTIDKVVTLRNATSTFKETDADEATAHNYGGWRTFSDDCALILPTGIKAYYASAINDETKAVELTEVPDGIIPAHCGVLIYNDKLVEGAGDINLIPFVNGENLSEYAYTRTLGKDNLLVDCYDKDRTISHNENGKYNYFLAYSLYPNDNTENEKFYTPLSFWKTLSNTKAKKNYTYLSVDDMIMPVSYDPYSQNYQYVSDANAPGNYCFLLSFGDDDNTEITGIEFVERNGNAVSDTWYTIQGMKIVKPTVPGIYIHNGKKYLVK